MPIESTIFLSAIAVVVAGCVRGFSGFGAGMVLVPILSLIYNPLVAVVTVVVLELIPTVQLLPGALKYCHWRSVIPMSLLACISIPVGAMLLIHIDAEIMRIWIACLILLCVFTLSIGWRYTGTDRYGNASMLTGFSSGIMSGAAGLGGLPVILYYLSGSHTASVSRASMIVFLVVTTFIALVTYLLHGIVTVEIAGFSVLLAPLFILATWAGKKMFGLVSDAIFRKAMLTMLGGIAIAMLFA